MLRGETLVQSEVSDVFFDACLIVLDGQTVIGLFVFHEETGQFFLRMECISLSHPNLRGHLRARHGNADRRIAQPLPGILSLASGVPQILPVGRLVTGTGKTGCVHKGLCQKHRVAVNSIPIIGNTLHIQAQHLRCQIRNPNPRQNQETGVVDNQRKPLPLHCRSSANPGIARPALEGRRGPTQQG